LADYRNYLLPKSEDTKEAKKYQLITCLSAVLKMLIGKLPEESHEILKKIVYYLQIKKDVTLEVMDARLNDSYQKQYLRTVEREGRI
jgi:hypothetical protein